MTYSKKQLMEKLDKMGAKYDPDASPADLDALYRELKTATTPTDEDATQGAETAPEDTDGVDAASEANDGSEDSESAAAEPNEDPDASPADLDADSPEDDTQACGDGPIFMVRVKGGKLALRSEPNKPSSDEPDNMIVALEEGQEFGVREIGDEWTYSEELEGWVMSKFIKRL